MHSFWSKCKVLAKLGLSGIIVVVPVGLVWLYIIYGGMFYLDNEYAYSRWNKEACSQNHEGAVKVIVIGDSVVNAALCPDYLSDSTYNLSLGGVSPAEMYYVLEEYLENNQAPEVCYIGFSDQGYITDQNLYKRILYFHRFSKEQEEAIFADAEAFGEQSILIEDYENERKKYRLWFPDKYISALMNGGIFMRYSSNMECYKVVNEHKGSWMSQNENWDTGADNIDYNSFPVGEMQNYYMEKILDLCAEKGITPRLVMIPVRPNIVCSIEYVEDWYKRAVLWQEHCPQMTYFYRPEGFEYEDFADDWHMNHNGAEKYSGMIKEIYAEDFE